MKNRKIDIVILCAGKCTRLGKMEFKNKCLIPYKEKTFIIKKLEDIFRSEKFNEIIVVLGHNSDDVYNELKNYFKYFKFKIVYQEEVNGIIGTLDLIKGHIETDELMLSLGDEYLYKPKYNGMVNTYYKNHVYIKVGYSI